MEERLVKYRVSNPGYKDRLVPGKLWVDSDYVYLEGPFQLKDDFKAMKGARWADEKRPFPDGRKTWSCDNVERNWFQLRYLLGENPYAPYLTPLDKSVFKSVRTQIKHFNHQIEMTCHGLQRHYCLICGEMGTGKTLAAIEIMEQSKVLNWWYVAPKSVITAVQLEFEKWFARVRPVFMTYEEMVRNIKNWPAGAKPPQGVIFDEFSRCKTPTSQRSQVAMHLANSVRATWGNRGFVIGMTGSPAPKSPLDWYWQCEVVCPGFLREGDIDKFKYRLAVITRRPDASGGRFPKLACWKNGDQTKCNICGETQDAFEHVDISSPEYHSFVPLENEVHKLYARLRGLAVVVFKKDCLDLPDKIYRVEKCKPNLDTLRAAQLIAATAGSAITKLTLLRELSDGFQYRETELGKETCQVCEGRKTIVTPGTTQEEPCPNCKATGTVRKVGRATTQVPCPKYDVLAEIMDEYSEVGRLVVYAGFTASIDRVADFCKSRGWEWIRVDGRGWTSSFGPTLDPKELIRRFQEPERVDAPERVVFIGHPGSAGMGLTLTASPAIVYFSNDFSGEARIQSEDRIHRPGMDTNRGATIIDLIHLPSDDYVRKNLKLKRELQSLSMGELKAAMENPIV